MSIQHTQRLYGHINSTIKGLITANLGKTDVMGTPYHFERFVKHKDLVTGLETGVDLTNDLTLAMYSTIMQGSPRPADDVIILGKDRDSFNGVIKAYLTKAAKTNDLDIAKPDDILPRFTVIAQQSNTFTDKETKQLKSVNSLLSSESKDRDKMAINKPLVQTSAGQKIVDRYAPTINAADQYRSLTLPKSETDLAPTYRPATGRVGFVPGSQVKLGNDKARAPVHAQPGYIPAPRPVETGFHQRASFGDRAKSSFTSDYATRNPSSNSRY